MGHIMLKKKTKKKTNNNNNKKTNKQTNKKKKQKKKKNGYIVTAIISVKLLHEFPSNLLYMPFLGSWNIVPISGPTPGTWPEVKRSNLTTSFGLLCFVIFCKIILHSVQPNLFYM